MVKHHRIRDTLAKVDAIVDEDQASTNEQELIELFRQEKAMGRKVLTYTFYSRLRDTTGRREDWILDQVDRGFDLLITDPELVKTA